MTDRWLLVSDVDETLFGDDDALRTFLERASGCHDRFAWALCSSRPLGSVKATIRSFAPRPEPDALVGALGTEIEVAGRPLLEWRERYHDWDRAAVDRVMREQGFAAHDGEFQTPFKASFTVPEADRPRALLALRRAGVHASVLPSGESDFDVFPENAGKGAAALRLRELLDVAPDRLVVAGDSLNDLSLFAASRRGIVVGNARPELRRALPARDIYFAQGRCAWGVMEGLLHHGVPIDGAAAARKDDE